jgi:hypothetical protein
MPVIIASATAALPPVRARAIICVRFSRASALSAPARVSARMNPRTRAR